MRPFLIVSSPSTGSSFYNGTDSWELTLVGATAAPRPFDGALLSSFVANPSNSIMLVQFELGRSAAVGLRIVDVRGRLVWERTKQVRRSGAHAILWPGRDTRGRRSPAGVYFYRLEADGQAIVGKAVLLR